MSDVDSLPTGAPVTILPGSCDIECQDGRHHYRAWRRPRRGALVAIRRSFVEVLFQGKHPMRFYLVRVPKDRVQPTV